MVKSNSGPIIRMTPTSMGTHGAGGIECCFCRCCTCIHIAFLKTLPGVIKILETVRLYLLCIGNPHFNKLFKGQKDLYWQKYISSGSSKSRLLLPTFTDISGTNYKTLFCVQKVLRPTILIELAIFLLKCISLRRYVHEHLEFVFMLFY